MNERLIVNPTESISYSRKKVDCCYHCGDKIESKPIIEANHNFCCEGCATVYLLLSEHNLCDYYDINQDRQSLKVDFESEKYSYLDLDEIRHKLVRYSDDHQERVYFYIPQIHCSSCIFLLENLNRLHPGFLNTDINFPKKELQISYDPSHVSLREVVELLAKIGYEPYLSLENLEADNKPKFRKDLLIKLGVAAFAFGNIMLLSFPEYLGASPEASDQLDIWFRYLALGLSIPVVFYCANSFFISAYKSLKKGILNIDAPIALAVGVTFLRSVYEVVVHQAPGFFDSMSGIVFFMLIGRYVQDRTYDWLHFERDYKSYFPLAVQTFINGSYEPKPIRALKKNDLIQIGHQEIIPADGVLARGTAYLDYGFVTGESEIVEKKIGQTLYAGAKHNGAPIEVQLLQKVSHSYLTSLWNKDIFKVEKQRRDLWLDKVSHYFTWLVILIATLTALFWLWKDSFMVLNTVTAVLIIACPCTLLLTASFTNGFVLNVFNKWGFYLRNASFLEVLAGPSAVVLDKTGTLTNPNDYRISYEGALLNSKIKSAIAKLTKISKHPLSKMLSSAFPLEKGEDNVLESFHEVPGAGTYGRVGKIDIRLGSASFCDQQEDKRRKGTKVYMCINGEFYGIFFLKQQYRLGIGQLFKRLQKFTSTYIISGDSDGDRHVLEEMTNGKTEMRFKQLPEMKLELIKELQVDGKMVIMVGDGLNDAGALRQSDLGVAVSNADNNFTPSSDAIIRSDQVPAFDRYITLAKKGRKIIAGCFAYSLLYNIMGLYFAVSGLLSPLLAAIIMPASSLSIIGASWALVKYHERKIFERKEDELK